MPKEKVAPFIQPSTDDKFATVDLTSIAHSILEESLKKLRGTRQKKYKLQLYIEDNESLAPEARNRVKKGHTLDSST